MPVREAGLSVAGRQELLRGLRRDRIESALPRALLAAEGVVDCAQNEAERRPRTAAAGAGLETPLEVGLAGLGARLDEGYEGEGPTGDALYTGSGSGLDFLRKGIERRNHQGVGGRGVSGDHVAPEMLVPTSPLLPGRPWCGVLVTARRASEVSPKP